MYPCLKVSDRSRIQNIKNLKMKHKMDLFMKIVHG